MLTGTSFHASSIATIMSKATMDYVSARAVDLRAKSTAAFEIATSKNPEKVRALLNLWFVPDFKPTFYDDRRGLATASLADFSLDDVELLDPSYSSAVADPGGQEVRYPVRMIDLDTKNLVEYPEIGTHGQYCILSHGWKGREVNYKYLADAKFKAYNRVLASKSNANTQQSDIDANKHQCWLDLAEQEERIKALVSESDILAELGLSAADNIVEKLLLRRIKVQILEKGHDGKGGFQKAKKKLAEAIANCDFEKMEVFVFKKLLGDIGLEDDQIDKVIDGQVEDQKLGLLDVDTAVAVAQEKLAEEMRKQSDEVENLNFFRRHGHIREAVDELIGCVQRCKSAIKIEMTIERSKEIFNKTLFSKAEKRYLWIDSCCINRADDGEYAKSISAMGEWYKNAEFCLVHLDTERDVPEDSLKDWKAIKSANVPQQPNITAYTDILSYQPQWSTRAWTLQELVMSKSTFYTNSNWELLSRPVERLGPWYYLCPFISLYTNVDTNNPYSAILNDFSNIARLIKSLEKGGLELNVEQSEAGDQEIVVAHKLIAILEALALHIPSDIDLQTARSRIAQAVHVAISSITGSNNGPKTAADNVLDNLLNALQPYSSSGDLSRVQCARHAINVLLKCIISLIDRPIQEDRNYIAAFGNVQGLDYWLTGLTRSNFSTQKCMSLVCPRDATVMTDKAYCLMGMLGVRFPTFHAEGLTKALSRLLDEVIITSNDVSVFNWTGKQYGSPIRGRSLYPSTPEGYRLSRDETRKKRRNKILAELLQIKRYEVMSDFLAIQSILLEVTTFAKNSQQKNLPLLWIMEILRVIKRRPFEKLKPHIPNIGKILKYIQTAFDSGSLPESNPGSPALGVGGSEEAALKQSSPLTSPSLSSFQSQMKMPSLPIEMPSFKAPKLSRKKTDAETTSTPPSKLGFGGFKAPSMKSFARADSGSTQPAGTNPTTSASKIANSISVPFAPSAGISENSRHPLDKEVLSYIRMIESNDEEDKQEEAGEGAKVSEPRLPSELEKVLADIPAREISKPRESSEEIETMISPNPITIKSSGIEGSFDIQRVIVSMIHPERLRRQIKNAVSPSQSITGWCTISTGFAIVLVSFACPKYILETELDLAQAVEAKVLKEQNSLDDDGENDRNTGPDENNNEQPQDSQSGPETKSQTWKRPMATRGLSRIQDRMNLEKDEAADNIETETEGPDFEKMKEEGAKVSRMIRFVQEPNLASIAGEWVLARFSGVPGAKWFLCYLELGGSGGDFYGHRIATDEIDFHNASPENGLAKCWEYYMMQKKHLLCSVLQKLMKSKGWGAFKTELSENPARRENKETGSTANVDDDELDSEDEDDGGGLSTTVKELGMVGAAGLMQKFYEWRAERLEKNLSAQVLKKFPEHLQAALESLDANKDLMPSMFHSAKKIHMF
ncbi:hypothetical protein HD806DRAFT_503144 [Xylariaceae sp. AK1471]|nr:hypothetical protein HD806DRAFT_503144 [Xylariaceae sp. AK1471]